VRRLRTTQYVGYGLGSLGTGGFGTVPGLLLAYYLTDTLAVPAALAGWAIFAPKVWDVVINPLVGRWSDRTAAARGDRRPWLLAGAVTLPIFFALTFSAPSLHGGGAALWVMIFFALAATGFSFFQVPYVAMPAEITDDSAERTTITAWRIGFLAIAILIFGAGAPLLVEAGGDGQGGYRLMGIVVGVAFGAGMLGAWWGTRRTRVIVPTEVAGNLWSQLKEASQHRPFVTLLAAFVVQACALGLVLASAPYFAEYVLGDSGLTAVLFASLVAPALIMMPFWHWVAGQVGKRNGFLISTLIFLIGTAGLMFARSLPSTAVYGLVAVVGVAYAGLQLFPLAMLPDAIADDARRTGRGRAGVFTGVWTASETAGMALGPFVLASVLLASSGYVSTPGEVSVTQPESALTGIMMGFSIVPFILVVASVPFLLRYRLPEVSKVGVT
jgi:glycoside/pentoside/hexuronide:cation symporter, GPH family